MHAKPFKNAQTVTLQLNKSSTTKFSMVLYVYFYLTDKSPDAVIHNGNSSA